jgi:sporulation protein YlmC with PRC-barrel domain
MKTRLIIVASALLLAGPVLAQEPLEKSGTEPSTTQNAPATTPMAPEPLDKSGTEPSPQAAPAGPTATEPLGEAGMGADKQAATAAPSGEIVIGELRESEDDNKMVGPLNANVAQVEEMDVLDASGKKIAEVDSVLEDKNGEIKGIAIEYGGFLGFGDRDAVITFDKIKQKDGNVVVEMTEDDLANLPAWHD